MNTVVRSFLVCLALFSLVLFSAACGGSDTAETAGGDSADVATSGSLKAGVDKKAKSAEGSLSSPEAELMKQKFKDMAALEGIYFGEVPEGFPLEFIPLHPDGEIDKSSIDEEGDFTLLQNVQGDKDTVFAWFKEFYTGLGWSVGNPFTTMGRTMIGIDGKDAEVSMTMIDKDGGKTFVALVLSPR